MPFTTKKLTAVMFDVDAVPLKQMRLDFQLATAGSGNTGHVANTIYQQFSNSSGVVEVDLIPSSQLQPGSYYLCRVVRPGEGLQRDIVLYTIGFYMPDYDAFLQDIATLPGEEINVDTLTDSGYLTYAAALGWSEEVTVTTAGSVTKNVVSGSFGEAGFVSRQSIKHGYASLSFNIPALIDAYVGFTPLSSDVLDGPTFITGVRIDLTIGGSIIVQVDDVTAIYTNTYVAGDNIEIIVDNDNIAFVYKNGTLVATAGSAITLAKPWYLSTAIKTDSGVIGLLTIGGDNVGGTSGA